MYKKYDKISNMKIGIFGGSFDPVHIDHVGICKKFKEKLNLDKVIVLPARQSPFKKGYGASGEHRKKMLEIAFEGCEYVEVSDFELNGETTSYTFITVTHFKNLYPNAQLYMLIGLDSLANFLTWKNPEIILQNCDLAVAGREGYDLTAEEVKFEKQTGKNLFTFEYNGIASSTCIREHLKLNLFPSKMMDEKVYEYIKNNELYKGDEVYSFVASKLKESRLYHTAGVVSLAISYAKKLGVSADNARIAGLLHDVAKYENAKNYPNCEIPLTAPESVKHQYLGAYIAENELGIKNEEILNAIKYHTTGRPNMGIIEKIVFVADLLEPSRTYEEAPYLRNAVNENFEEGFKLCVARLNSYLKRTGGDIFYLTEKANEYYNLKK